MYEVKEAAFIVVYTAWGDTCNICDIDCAGGRAVPFLTQPISCSTSQIDD